MKMLANWYVVLKQDFKEIILAEYEISSSTECLGLPTGVRIIYGQAVHDTS